MPRNATGQGDPEVRDRRARALAWLRRIGVAGFLFFLIKGLAWIAVWTLGVKGCQALVG
jgi:hypothetical protein